MKKNVVAGVGLILLGLGNLYFTIAGAVEWSRNRKIVEKMKEDFKHELGLLKKGIEYSRRYREVDDLEAFDACVDISIDRLNEMVEGL